MFDPFLFSLLGSLGLLIALQKALFMLVLGPGYRLKRLTDHPEELTDHARHLTDHARDLDEGLVNSLG